MPQYLPAIECSAQSLDKVGDQDVPTLQPTSERTAEETRLPFDTSILAALETFVPMITPESLRSHDTTGRAAKMLLQLNEHHGRSAVLDIASLNPNTKGLPSLEPRVIWSDEHGNPFSSLGYKGNFSQAVHIMDRRTDPTGFRFNGVQTSYSAARIIKVSELLRRHGVDTEMVTGQYKPKELPFRGRLMRPEVIKQILLLEESGIIEGPVRRGPEEVGDESPGPTKERIEALGKALGEMDFMVTQRAMLIPDRLHDLTQSREAAEDILTRAMRVWKALNPDFKATDPLDPNTLQHFLTNVIARRFASNLRKMHDLGLAHRMLHPGNITMLGGIIDLDSVIGEEIGLVEADQNVSKEHYMQDFWMYLTDRNYSGSIYSTLKALAGFGLIADIDTAYNQFMISFFDTYSAPMLPIFAPDDAAITCAAIDEMKKNGKRPYRDEVLFEIAKSYIPAFRDFERNAINIIARDALRKWNELLVTKHDLEAMQGSDSIQHELDNGEYTSEFVNFMKALHEYDFEEEVMEHFVSEKYLSNFFDAFSARLDEFERRSLTRKIIHTLDPFMPEESEQLGNGTWQVKAARKINEAYKPNNSPVSDYAKRAAAGFAESEATTTTGMYGARERILVGNMPLGNFMAVLRAIDNIDVNFVERDNIQNRNRIWREEQDIKGPADLIVGNTSAASLGEIIRRNIALEIVEKSPKSAEIIGRHRRIYSASEIEKMSETDLDQEDYVASLVWDNEKCRVLVESTLPEEVLTRFYDKPAGYHRGAGGLYLTTKTNN